MRWLSRIHNTLTMLVLLGILGLVALVLASALAGRGLPFTGGFASSDEPLSFERLVIRASDQGGIAEGAEPSRPSPAPTATADPASAPAVTTDETHTSGLAAGSSPAPTAMPVTPPAPDATAGSGDSAQSIGGGSTFASLPAVETSSKTKGATTITWESSFANHDYTLGDVATMTVNWTVDGAAASYDSFALKGDTPTSRKDPAGVTALVTYPGARGPTSVDVSLAFTELHLDAERDVEIGNAHFKLYLEVDADGDGVPETLVGYGVSVHVEGPQ